MLVITMHADVYDSCGIYDICWYLHFMLILTMHAGIYEACWYLRHTLVFMLHASWYKVSIYALVLVHGLYLE